MKLELTKEEINFVLQALAQLPYTQVAGLIQKIASQVTEEPKEKK